MRVRLSAHKPGLSPPVRPFQGGTPIFPLINVCLFMCVFCVFVAIYIHVVFLSWFCAVRVAVCCECCVSCMNSSLSFTFTTVFFSRCTFSGWKRRVLGAGGGVLYRSVGNCVWWLVWWTWCQGDLQNAGISQHWPVGTHLVFMKLATYNKVLCCTKGLHLIIIRWSKPIRHRHALTLHAALENIIDRTFSGVLCFKCVDNSTCLDFRNWHISCLKHFHKSVFMSPQSEIDLGGGIQQCTVCLMYVCLLKKT